MMFLLATIDLAILEWLQANLHHPILDAIFLSITALGNYGLVWVLLGLALILTKKYRHIGITLMLALAFSFVVTNLVLKNMVQRPRPFISYDYLKALMSNASGYSFPSGHATSAFAAAMVFYKYLPKYKVVFFGIASLVAFSRLYLLVHYPTDVIAGSMLGIISGWVAYRLIQHYDNLKKA